MRILKTIFLLGLCCITLGSAQRPEPSSRIDAIIATLNNPRSRLVLVVAHRGDWRHSIENSLAAIQHAIAIGADVVEIDVRRTADGQLVLMHDATIDRTTNGHGKVAELTLDSIRRCRLLNRDGSLSELRVPTLEEVFLLSKDQVMLNIDKGYNIFADVYAIAQKTGVTRQIIMKGGAPVEQVQKDLAPYLDHIFYMPIVNLEAENAMQILRDFDKKMRPVAYELLYKNDTSELPQHAKKLIRGRSLTWYNTLWNGMAGTHYDDLAVEKGPEAVYGFLIDSLNTRIIQTDRSEMVIEYLRKRGLHP